MLPINKIHKFEQKLYDRQLNGHFRELTQLENSIDFWSNDYLGIARNHPFTAELKGSTGSRLISGNSSIAEKTEEYIAIFFQSEAALVFNSGYDANLGFFSSIPQKGNIVIYDELIHASVRDGIRLSFATSYSFKHNDVSDLERIIRNAIGTVFVAVESLYSMDGDSAPLQKLVEICEKYGALLVVDEAHSGGIFGKEGRGLMYELGLEKRCFARLFTFGKAFGAHGAAICSSHLVRNYLINFARSFIYTTALPNAHFQHIQHSIEVAKNTERNLLFQHIKLFQHLMGSQQHDFLSPIQVVNIDSIKKCLALSKRLQEQQIGIKAILPPTVPENGQRLRVCLHTHNTEEEIRNLVRILREH